MSKNMSEATGGKTLSFIHGGLMPFLAFILFAILYFAVSKLIPPSIGDITSENVLKPFQKYAPFGGAAAGLLSMLGMYILYLFRRLFRLNRSRLSAPVILMLGYAPWAAFGYQLVYREPRYATIAKAIISFIGAPLLYAGSAMVALGFLWLATNLFVKK